MRGRLSLPPNPRVNATPGLASYSCWRGDGILRGPWTPLLRVKEPLDLLQSGEMAGGVQGF